MEAPVRAVYKNGQLRLLDPVDLAENEEVSITIRPAMPPKSPSPRRPNLHPGEIWMSDDFDDPLPDEFWLGEDE